MGASARRMPLIGHKFLKNHEKLSLESGAAGAGLLMAMSFFKAEAPPGGLRGRAGTGRK